MIHILRGFSDESHDNSTCRTCRLLRLPRRHLWALLSQKAQITDQSFLKGLKNTRSRSPLIAMSFGRSIRSMQRTLTGAGDTFLLPLHMGTKFVPRRGSNLLSLALCREEHASTYLGEKQSARERHWNSHSSDIFVAIRSDRASSLSLLGNHGQHRNVFISHFV